MFTTRTLWEGRWPLLVLLVLSVAGLWWCSIAAALPLLLLAFTIAFFRDPAESVPADPALIVAPAYGKVVEIRLASEPHFLKSEATMVAIFLSVFDVHVQRAPIGGEVKFVHYQPGKFHDARRPEAGAENEARIIGLQGADGYSVTVRQIAGLIARRVVGWVDAGTQVAKGDRLGMIRFGSRVELYLPAGAEITVTTGQHVRGGATIIARRATRA